MEIVKVLILLPLAVFLTVIHSEISSGRIKGDDEPHMVSWRVLEGVTEPFESGQVSDIPAWQQMKISADQKSASQMVLQALHEYGQLLRHPYLFGDMPMEERYDIFLSMSSLLKTMGFHQRAELLLYEAMSYTAAPYEAHLQLGLLFVDKEDLEKAKMHFKNCLFFRENDLLILVHMTVILIAEGRNHEAKFFLSRIIGSLESRVSKLSFVLAERGEASDALLDYQRGNRQLDVDYKVLAGWVERELFAKTLHGEFRIAPTALFELRKLFANLYKWLAAGEMSGRFLFDLGQSLYESGRPQIGRAMMVRGRDTSDAAVEGAVSMEVIRLRLALDCPVVPDSVLEVVAAYLNMTAFLAGSAAHYPVLDGENLLDLYWSLPLSAWTALPIAPVLRELLYRFDLGPPSSSSPSSSSSPHWAGSNNSSGSDYDAVLSSFYAAHPGGGVHYSVFPGTTDSSGASENAAATATDAFTAVEVGILGGHLNSHPVGHMLFHRLLAGLGARSNFSWGGGTIRFTLIALPLVSDGMTARIAGHAHRIVNLPMDLQAAWQTLQGLRLDVLIFPDWQPFPDQLSVLLQARRVAPLQMCLFVRGTSCASGAVDYYLLPQELQGAYLAAQPAADPLSKVAHATNEHSFTGATQERLQFLRPPWREQYPEQVVLLDWPLVTPHIVQDVADATARSQRQDESADAGGGGALELEGRIFFDGQPVAVLPLYPMQLHPLMDDTLFRVLRTVPALHLVIALPQSFFAHIGDVKHRMSWARKLVRRLWSAGGNLFHRIRMLPAPVSDARLLQLLRQADMVLDSFPSGGGLHILALATSVGTPVVTLRSGTRLQTPKEDLRSVRQYIQQLQAAEQRSCPAHPAARTGESCEQTLRTNPLSQHLVLRQLDVPWSPSMSSAAGFYERVGLHQHFVANSTAEYIALAVRLAEDRERAYDLRVRLLESVDRHHRVRTGSDATAAGKGPRVHTVPASVPPPKAATSKLLFDDGEEEEEEDVLPWEDEWDKSVGDDVGDGGGEVTGAGQTARDGPQLSDGRSGGDSGCVGACNGDLGRFLVRMGLPFAHARSALAGGLHKPAPNTKRSIGGPKGHKNVP